MSAGAPQNGRGYPQLARDVRRLVVLLFLAGCGMAVATLLRPAGGYRRALPLVWATLAGCGAGALLLLGLAALAVAVSRRSRLSDRSLADAAASYPVVAAALVVATIAVVAVSLWPRNDHQSVSGVTHAAFTKWQGDVVPVAVSFGQVLRGLAAAEHKPLSHRLQGGLARSRRTIRQLLIAVGAELAREAGSRQLHRLTSLLERAVRSAGAAAADLTAATSAASSSGRAAAKVAVRRARAELTAAALTTQKFTFEANGLGGRLAASPPPGS